jgi:CubicO group peptidase (beta-lactamase class C family)
MQTSDEFRRHSARCPARQPTRPFCRRLPRAGRGHRRPRLSRLRLRSAAGNEVVLADARGRFTYDEDLPAVAPETVYDVASITKVAATTAAAMLLHQRGLLRLETPLGELLPGFVANRAAGDPARRVTLRHLLAHNSGLPGYVEFFRTAATPDALLKPAWSCRWRPSRGRAPSTPIPASFCWARRWRR